MEIRLPPAIGDPPLGRALPWARSWSCVHRVSHGATRCRCPTAATTRGRGGEGAAVSAALTKGWGRARKGTPTGPLPVWMTRSTPPAGMTRSMPPVGRSRERRVYWISHRLHESDPLESSTATAMGHGRHRQIHYGLRAWRPQILWPRSFGGRRDAEVAGTELETYMWARG